MSKPTKILIKGHTHILHTCPQFTSEEIQQKSVEFYNHLNSRRSVRDYSEQPIAKEVIENIIKTASTAPSGAHKQPWTFCAISNPALKAKIRKAAEIEEKESYENRMSEEWLKDLEHIGTDHHKPFITEAPWIIVAFKKTYDIDSNGNKTKNYYVNESCGIAAGMLISAIHNAGLATLTHTPSPMNFLSDLLKRPKNEKAFLLLPVGYPKEQVYVPDLKRKALNDISEFYE